MNSDHGADARDVLAAISGSEGLAALKRLKAEGKIIDYSIEGLTIHITTVGNIEEMKVKFGVKGSGS